MQARVPFQAAISVCKALWLLVTGNTGIVTLSLPLKDSVFDTNGVRKLQKYCSCNMLVIAVDVEGIWICCIIELAGFANGLVENVGEWNPASFGHEKLEGSVSISQDVEEIVGVYLGSRWEEIWISLLMMCSA